MKSWFLSSPGTIEDDQLLLDEHGFGHHGAGATWTDELGDRRNQMSKKDGQIAHVRKRKRTKHREIREMLTHLVTIRHAHV
jgi:hypothetical protein